MQNTMRFSELHCREVINLCDGARMGEVSDLLFDPVCGQITALVVPAQSGIAGLFSFCFSQALFNEISSCSSSFC